MMKTAQARRGARKLKGSPPVSESSKAFRLFELAGQREYALCQHINKIAEFWPEMRYCQLGSRLGDGWFWYALILATPLLERVTGPGLALLPRLNSIKQSQLGDRCIIIAKSHSKPQQANRPLAI